MIKVDYSYEALVKYHPETYAHEATRLSTKSPGSFISKLAAYLQTVATETLKRSKEMLLNPNFHVRMSELTKAYCMRDQYDNCYHDG